jgi:hypothetical protein
MAERRMSVGDNIKPLRSGRTSALELGPGPVVAKVREVSETGLVLELGSESFAVGRMTKEVAGTPPDQLQGSEVLVVYESGDHEKPIAIAVLHSPDIESAEIDGAIDETTIHSIVDDEQVVLNARRKIELRCGKGSITITPDGKIVLRGTHLLSRSSGPLRIKGGHVDIN